MSESQSRLLASEWLDELNRRGAQHSLNTDSPLSSFIAACLGAQQNIPELVAEAFATWQRKLFVGSISTLEIGELTTLIENSDPRYIAEILKSLTGGPSFGAVPAPLPVVEVVVTPIRLPEADLVKLTIPSLAPSPAPPPAPVVKRKSVEEVRGTKVAELKRARDARRSRLAKEREERKVKRTKEQAAKPTPKPVVKKVEKVVKAVAPPPAPAVPTDFTTKANMAASRRVLVRNWTAATPAVKQTHSLAVRKRDYPGFSETDFATSCKTCAADWPDEAFICPATDKVYHNCPSCRRADKAHAEQFKAA